MLTIHLLFTMKDLYCLNYSLSLVYSNSFSLPMCLKSFYSHLQRRAEKMWEDSHGLKMLTDYILYMYIWVKVFKSGPIKIYGRQPLKNSKWYGLHKQTVLLQIFKGYIPQILLALFLITLINIRWRYHWRT